MGYERNDSKLLFDAMTNSIVGKTPKQIKETPYGLKLTYETMVKAKDGNYKSANVVSVLQKDKGKIYYKIITAYPGKKAKK